MKEIVLVRRRLWTILALRLSLTWLAICAFAAGSAVLFAKTLLHHSIRPQWLLIPVPLGIICCCLLALRKLPQARSLAALIDNKNRLGGLLMATQDIAIGDWAQSLRTISLPKIRWHAGRSVSFCFVSFIFAAVCIEMPQRFIAAHQAQVLNVGPEIENLKQDIDLLKQEAAVEQPKAAELEQKLDSAKQNSADTDPVKTWEALDTLKQDIENAASAAASKTIAEVGQLAQAQDLASSLSDSNGLDAKSLADAMNQLSQQMQQLSKTNPGLSSALASAANKSLTPEELKKMCDSLSNCKQGKCNSVSKMCRAGLCDSKLQSMCDSAGQCRSRCQGNCKGSNGFHKPSAGASGRPGAPGPHDPDAEAPINFGDETDQQNSAFKEKALTPAALGGLDQSDLVGISSTMPQVQSGEVADSGPVSTAAAGTGQAYKTRILPRHKNTVNKYFERTQQ